MCEIIAETFSEIPTMGTLITIASILSFAFSSAINPNKGDAIVVFENLKNQARVYANNEPKNIAEDTKLLVPKIIKNEGYPVEVHLVTTSKGYILETYRIPFGKNGTSANRPVVYLQHGLFTASSDWVISGPEKGFAYILADSGYDVWLPNCRGNTYSRKHVSLDPDQDGKEFWAFSFHELAVEDLPEMIDYVIEKTKQEKIFYIGHSQGTTISYVLCSEKPEYNQKFRAIFSLAPVSYIGNMFSPPIRLAAAIYDILTVINRLGLHEIFPHTKLASTLGPIFCAENSIIQPFCIGGLFGVNGFTPDQMNKTLFPLLVTYYPAGASSRQGLHFLQLVNSGKFRQYDHGLAGNLEKYRLSSPPDYKLDKVVAPVYLHYSSDDWQIDMKDVEKLHNELGNSQGKFLISGLNHLDFLFGIDVPTILYEKILNQMEEH